MWGLKVFARYLTFPNQPGILCVSKYLHRPLHLGGLFLSYMSG